MESFLKNTALNLFRQYGEEISRFCIIFPNRRAGLFFREFLAKHIPRPLWSPQIITISDFVESYSDITRADRLTLVFELYHVYKHYRKNTGQFDDFYYWGEMMLNDFDDIDKYMVNPNQLFKNISSLKDIDNDMSFLSSEQIEAIKSFWKSFDLQGYSEQKKEFRNIWQVLPDIYKDFKEALMEKGIGYEGMQYHQLAENTKSNSFPEMPFRNVCFIGFNALNACEETIFNYLKNKGCASFYWDYDEYYVKNENHQAGLFLRQNLKKFPDADLISNKNHFIKEKNISFYAVPTETGQAKILAHLFKEHAIKEEQINPKTAIVLANEGLLPAVLYSLPEYVDSVNVTMGYPLKNSVVYSFVKNLIDLQRNTRIQNEKAVFYHKNVIRLLRHQFIYTIEHNVVEPLIQDIVNKNRVYLEPEALHANEFLKRVFETISNSNDIFDYIMDLLYELLRIYNTDENADSYMELEQEFVYHIFKQFKLLKESLNQHSIDYTTNMLLLILDKVIQKQRVPFEGEPLAGIQIMGVLETRTLDFENLIILSMNEGDFPKSSSFQSFIPYNLRKGFKMPVKEHIDAMYSYYFYRLFQRAKNISLVYSTKSDGFQKGEMSRYLYQLKYETDFNINEQYLTHNINTDLPLEITIEKVPAVLRKLDRYTTKVSSGEYLSATALNTYLDCPLKFYFKYIEKIEEKKEVTEDIDPLLFGNLLHYSIYQLYEPYRDEEISKDLLEYLKMNDAVIDEAIKKAFLREFFKDDDENIQIYGRNIIIRDVLKKYIKQIIEIDQKITPFSVIELEKSFQCLLTINNTAVQLGGKIDRLDRVGNHLRIIDYKTGNPDKSIKTIESVFEQEKYGRNSEAFQILFYTYLFDQQKSNIEDICPGIYKLRDVFSDQFDYQIILNKEPITTFKYIKGEFENHLSDLLKDIYNPDISFYQTNDLKVCEKCVFKALCHREV
jgi:hypothetical protein